MSKASNTNVSITYFIQLFVVLLLTISVLLPSPLHHQDSAPYRQWLVPTNIWLTRLIDPLTEKLKWSSPDGIGMPSFTRLETSEQVQSDSRVFDFIHEHTLTADTEHATFADIGKNRVSPLTRAMVMMGCYGDPQTNRDMHSAEVQRMAGSTDMAFMLNILLNFWETENVDLRHAQNYVMSAMHNVISGHPVSVDHFAPHNDRSACSCMKDFASPAVLRVDMDKTVDGDRTYAYDSCLLQNVVDYANTKKNRQDPMIYELERYFKVLEAKYRNTPHTRRLLTAANASDANASNASRPRWETISTDRARKENPELMTLLNVLFKNASASRSRRLLASDGLATLKDLKTYLVQYIENEMFAHNKLRTPVLSSDKTDEELLYSQMPPVIPAYSFETYMKKYRSAYEVCTHAGVPRYQTKKLVRLAATRFGELGMAFLLAAVVVGFSTCYKRKYQEGKSGSITQDGSVIDKDPEKIKFGPYHELESYAMILTFFEFVVKLLIWIALFVALSRILADLGSSEYALEKNTALQFVLVLWFVFTLLIVASYSRDAYNLMLSPCDPKDDLVPQQIVQDVAIIAGLSNLAVAFRLQRGDGDESVVMACFVLFITIGLVQHMSNLVRMMQQFVQQCLRKNLQAAPSAQDSHITERVAYNRVAITVVVIIGLMSYVILASSTLQVWTPDVIHGEQHARLFAICAFFIFSAYDIFFEVLTAATYRAAEFQQQHPRKMMWTSWTIVVSLLLLHMHYFFGLCYSRQQMADKDSCSLMRYFF